MKKLLYIVFFCHIGIWATENIDAQKTTTIIDHEFHISANNFTNYVYRRFYFINRLHKTMILFFALDKSIPTKKILLDHNLLFSFDILPFQHEKIKKSVIDMQQKRSLKPLFMIWNDFSSYQSIDDQLLVEEFTKEILVISRNLIISSQTIPNEEQKIYFSDFFKTITLPSCALLDIIDKYVSLFLHYNPSLAEAIHSKHGFTYPGNGKRIVDLKPFVHVDEVMERFYHIKRLAKPLALLEKANNFSANISMEYVTQEPFLKLHNLISFSHPNIISCIKVMNQTLTLEPLIELWEDIEQYKHIHDTQFVREFLLLVYATYIELHMQKSATQKNISQEMILQTIESLPLEDILHAIDMLSNDLPPLLEKFELKSNLSWHEWFKKYWWAPPVVGVILGCKILIAIKISKILKPKAA